MSSEYSTTGANAFLDESLPVTQNTGDLPSTFIETLQRASNNVFPTSPSSYNKVLVVLLAWEDDNPEYKTEVEKRASRMLMVL